MRTDASPPFVDSRRAAEFSSARAAVTKPSRARYHTLDGVRGVAALFVAAYHFITHGRNDVWFPGYLAVDLFFVLSGFVIALNYEPRLRAGMTVRDFASKRLIRLFPVYALGLLLGWMKQAAGLLAGDPRAMHLAGFACATAAGIVMLPSPCSEKLFPFNPPSWSLFFELAVNLLFAVWMWKSSSRALMAGAIASLVALTLTVGPALHLNVGWVWSTADVAVFRTTFSFSIGVLICRYFGRRRIVTWAAVLPIVGMALLLSASPRQTLVSSEQLLTVAIAFPLIVMLGIRFEAPSYLARTFNFLGDISYPVYAVHYPLVRVLVVIFSRLRVGPAVQLVLFLGTLTAIGYIVAKFDARVRKQLTSLTFLRATPCP